MSEFKKSVKATGINKKAAAREMPDPAILERVKETGINQAMKNYNPPRGTTVIRTKADAQRAVKVL